MTATTSDRNLEKEVLDLSFRARVYQSKKHRERGTPRI